MSKRSWYAILTAISVLMALGLTADEPPRDLHLADQHWTAWNPPSMVPAGSQIYIVQPGDSLWGLAQRFLGDGHLWPQIWEANQYILDSHWIYPDDPLVMTPSTVATLEAEGIAAVPLEEASVEPEDPFSSLINDRDSQSRAGTDAPVPLGYEADIYCSGYIGDDGESFPFRIAGSEYEFLTPTLDPQKDSEIKGLYGKTNTQKYGLGLGDIVYLDGGRADGLSAGEMLTGIEPAQLVEHPRTGNNFGRLNRYLGRVRLLSVQESTAIGEIVLSCYPMPVGTALQVFEPEPVPLRRMTTLRPVNYPAKPEELDGSPSIIFSENDIVALGMGHLVYIDRGSNDNTSAGDIFTIYRQGRRGFPPIVLGELGVLSVHENASLARILRSRYTIFLGDALQIK